MWISRLLAGAAIGTLAIGLSLGTAEAATARASNAITIYAGPGYGYAPIGRLAANAVVSLAECTRSGRWCRIEHGGPDGWVLASYLVGSAAKVNATPFRPLVNPFYKPFRLRQPPPAAP